MYKLQAHLEMSRASA